LPETEEIAAVALKTGTEQNDNLTISNSIKVIMEMQFKNGELKVVEN